MSRWEARIGRPTADVIRGGMPLRAGATHRTRSRLDEAHLEQIRALRRSGSEQSIAKLVGVAVTTLHGLVADGMASAPVIARVTARLDEIAATKGAA